MAEEKAAQQDEKSSVIDIEDDKKKENPEESSAGIKDYLRVFAYSDKWDWLLNAAGAVAAMASGASLAL